MGNREAAFRAGACLFRASACLPGPAARTGGCFPEGPRGRGWAASHTGFQKAQELGFRHACGPGFWKRAVRADRHCFRGEASVGGRGSAPRPGHALRCAAPAPLRQAGGRGSRSFTQGGVSSRALILFTRWWLLWAEGTRAHPDLPPLLNPAGPFSALGGKIRIPVRAYKTLLFFPKFCACCSLCGQSLCPACVPRPFLPPGCAPHHHLSVTTLLSLRLACPLPPPRLVLPSVLSLPSLFVAISFCAGLKLCEGDPAPLRLVL